MVECGGDSTRVAVDQMPPLSETSKSLLEKQVSRNQTSLFLIFLHMCFAKIFSTQKRVNHDKTDFTTKQCISQEKQGTF